MESGEIKDEDKRFRDCDRKAGRYCPDAAGWHTPEEICSERCHKRDGKHPETNELLELRLMIAGGMPVARNELPADVWAALGILAGKDRIRLF